VKHRSGLKTCDELDLCCKAITEFEAFFDFAISWHHGNLHRRALELNFLIVICHMMCICGMLPVSSCIRG
jgi:hypothetical protein